MSEASDLISPNGSQSAAKKSFSECRTPNERRKYANELMEKVKGHIPVVLELPKDIDSRSSESNKVVLIGSTLKVLNFLEFFRKKITAEDSSAFFLFANETYLVKTSDLMGEIYSKYKSKDGFLYLKLSKKAAWG